MWAAAWYQHVAHRKREASAKKSGVLRVFFLPVALANWRSGQQTLRDRFEDQVLAVEFPAFGLVDQQVRQMLRAQTANPRGDQ